MYLIYYIVIYEKKVERNYFPPFNLSSSSSYNLSSMYLNIFVLEFIILLSTTGLLLLYFSLQVSQTKFSTSLLPLSDNIGFPHMAQVHSIIPIVFSYTHFSTTLLCTGSYIRFRYWLSTLSKSFANLRRRSSLSLSQSANILSEYMV